MNFKLFFLALNFLFFYPLAFSQNSFDADTVLEQLYGNRCGSKRWINFALEDSKAVISSLESLRENTSCASSASVIAGLGNLNLRISELQGIISSNQELARINSSQESLLNLYQTTQDDLLKDSLLSIIHQNEISRITFESEVNSIFSQRPSLIQIKSAQIINSTDALLGQLTSNASCLNDNPNLLASAFSLSTSIASALTISNPLLSTTLASVSDLTGKFIEHFRKLKLNRKINKIKNKTTRRNIFRCAIEGMTQKYCQIRDADILNSYQYKMKTVKKEINKTSFADSFRFYEEAFPALISWLSDLRTGVEPTNSFEAQRQERFFSRERFVITAEKTGLGYIREFQEISAQIVRSDNERYEELLWANIKNLISTIEAIGTSQFGSSNTFGNPITEIFNTTIYGYRLLGITPFIENGLNGEVVLSFSSNFGGGFDPINNPDHERYLASIGLNIDLDLFETIKKNFESIINQVLNRVQSELTLVTKPDPSIIYENVYKRDNGRYFSAYDAISFIREYLIDNNFLRDDKHKIPLFYSTINLFKDLKEIIDEQIVEDEASSDSLSDIYDLLKLSNGTSVIEERLKTLFQMIVLRKLEKVEGLEKIIVSKFLAQNQIFEVFSQVRQKQIFSEEVDIRDAKKIATANIDNFINYFSRNIKKVLEELNLERSSILKKMQVLTKRFKESKHFEENLKVFKKDLDERSQEIGQYCFLILSASNWPEDIPLNLCLGSSLRTLKEEGAPVLSNFSKEMLYWPNERKQCLYQDYKRRMNVWADWQRD